MVSNKRCVPSNIFPTIQEVESQIYTQQFVELPGESMTSSLEWFNVCIRVVPNHCFNDK